MAMTFPALSEHIVELKTAQAQSIYDFLKRHAYNPFAPGADFERFVTQSFSLTQVLPPAVLEALVEFRKRGNDDGVLLIRGVPIEDDRIGPTPKHWSSEAQTKTCYETEMYLLGASSVLGEVFAFSTQHEGNIVQNVVPIPADMNEQVGTGSRAFLEWHTEDAFHPWCADFIGLLCLRSDPYAATTFASIKRMRLPENYKRVLFEKKFQAGIDKAHGGSGRPEDSDSPVISVLFGQYEDPYLHLDTSCIRALPGEAEAQQALEYFTNEMSAVARQVVLQQGDLLFLDNYRVVHGRTAFIPRFDGTDRWLQRVSVAADFRKSFSGRTKQFRVIEMNLKLLAV